MILEQESVKNEVLMLCKGAESHVMPRCIAGHTPETLEHINDYAKVSMVICCMSQISVNLWFVRNSVLLACMCSFFSTKKI